MATGFKYWIYSRGCLFGGVKLTKNADTDKYPYSGFGDGSVDENVNILELIWAHLCILMIKEKIS